MGDNKLVDRSLKKSHHLDQINLKVSAELKQMWKDLKHLEWDVAELARQALNRAFKEALDIENKSLEN